MNIGVDVTKIGTVSYTHLDVYKRQEEPRDGMVIYTHTERLRKNRKLIVELLLAAHCRDCTTCDKHGRCKLQKLAYQLGINNVPVSYTHLAHDG